MEGYRPNSLSAEAQRAASLAAEKADQEQYEKEFYGLDAQLAEIDAAIAALEAKNDPESVQKRGILKNRKMGLTMKQGNLKIRHTERRKTS